MVGLGQAEAPDQFARGQLGQVLAALLLRAVGVDRVHDQGRLHAHGRAVAAVDALDLAGDQAVGDMVDAGPAVLLGQGGAQKPEGAHLGHDLAVEALLAGGGQDPRLQGRLTIVAGGVADHPFVVGELVFQAEGIGPVESGHCGHHGLLRC